MPETIPLTVTPEAAGFISELQLQEPYQKMLEHIPLLVPGVKAVAVSLQPPYDLGGGPRVIFDVTRDMQSAEIDPIHDQWKRWVIESFPPEVFSRFCLLANYA